MQHMQTTRATETAIQGRYSIEGVLGEGGFSTVYLVKDQQANGSLFALKELIDTDKHERDRFLFEGEVLKRLNHYALPRFHDVFEAGNRNYILMEYIEGQNLQVLRRQQSTRYFSLPLVLNFMAPILDAVAYLHSQEPPILHRDIKPANIIVSPNGNRVVLVDFGIAKEYHSDSTTTAARHCSPGYGAPEQYSEGTDVRTDIYGLGATLYALVTGVTPVDSLQRATQLGSKGIDPLVPVKKLAPQLPIHVAEAIERAISMRSDKRFSSIEELRRALNGDALPQHEFVLSSQSERQPPMASEQAVKYTPRQKRFRVSSPRTLGMIVFTILLLLALSGIGLGSWLYVRNVHNASVPSTQARSTPGASQIQSPPASISPLYPDVAKPYSGTVHDLLTNVSTEMTLTSIHQHDEMIKGDFVGLHTKGLFTGVLDTSRHILFTVRNNAGQGVFFFEGSVRSDDNLAGNYCRLDQAGQCVGNYGLWSVSAASP